MVQSQECYAKVQHCARISVLAYTQRRRHTVMGRALSPLSLLLLLLLLLLIALSPGGAPGPTLALDCDDANTVVKERETQVIVTMDIGTSELASIIMFVKPESDFEGVRVDVQESDGTHHSAWFPAECFPRNGMWQQFLPDTWITKRRLDLRFVFHACGKECKITTVQRGPHSLSVVAHGPSRWIKGRTPTTCDVTFAGKSWNAQLPTCQDPPSTKKITTTTITTTNTTSGKPSTLKTQGKINIIAASAAGMVAVLVVVLVLVIGRKRNFVTPPNEVKFQSKPEVPNCHPQFTASHDNEGFSSDILPDLPARPVIVSRPAQFHPAIPKRNLQFTTDQGRNPDQDEEEIYYEILPDLTTRRVIVSQPTQDSEEHIYEEIMPKHDVRFPFPVNENVSPPSDATSPHGHLEVLGTSGLHIYDTV
ncbi:uncharacterized protein LOC135114896 isoform X2 [Scylla paramamosain]|uniref:uncharacterized protein LOC135114896 isoform X2 n=1 Tax=Scylla paramamosain TaxID=85552 RepID=UPI00308287F5